jgi:hypothetical protein
MLTTKKLNKGEKNVVTAFISSKTQKIRTTIIAIDEKQPEFKQTGLKLRIFCVSFLIDS